MRHDPNAVYVGGQPLPSGAHVPEDPERERWLDEIFGINGKEIPPELQSEELTDLPPLNIVPARKKRTLGFFARMFGRR